MPVSPTERGAHTVPHGSRTMTLTATSETEAGPSNSSPSRESTPSAVGVLRLRGGPVRRPHVVWTSETVDNEGMGKKKSKICCIYHKPRRYDESSSESDSCSSDDGDHHHRTPSERAGPQNRQTAGVQRSSQRTEVKRKEESSESEGGGGDGRARPLRRTRPKSYGSPKANKYDCPPLPKEKGKR